MSKAQSNAFITIRKEFVTSRASCFVYPLLHLF